MKNYRKSITHKKGFTLLEVLVSLFILSIGILLLSSCIKIMKGLTMQNYASEDQIAVLQLRILLAKGDHMQILGKELHFEIAQNKQWLQLHNHRLVKRDGYEIFLKDIDDIAFIEERGCIQLEWKREKKTKSAMLVCE